MKVIVKKIAKIACVTAKSPPRPRKTKKIILGFSYPPFLAERLALDETNKKST